MASLLLKSVGTLLFLLAAQRIWQGVYNYLLHPLAAFPGPQFAHISSWYKTIQEVFLGRSWIDVLVELHSRYGDVVRVGPNELHFSKPSAYMDIYNASNRWDKEHSLYHCFGEDRSSFGYLTYAESKQRKDIMAPLFSKRAISDLQGLLRKNIDRLCDVLAANDSTGKASDLLFGLRCFTLDTITQFCFAKDVDAIGAPAFQSPIVVAMDASLGPFVVFRNFEPIRRIVFSLPGWLTKLSTPELAGLVDMQEILGAQVRDVTRNPKALKATSHPIIYHRLLDPELSKGAEIPPEGSLYEEAQALLFGGADSAANTTMVGLFHLLSNPPMYDKVKTEVNAIWPEISQAPRFEDLEQLPYLTAVINESLRMAPGVPAPLPRIVPLSGATISGRAIPAGTIVGMSMHFVHRAGDIFSDPDTFNPDRWLMPDSSKLEKWLVSFSRGPRSCLGQNLAMVELYLAFAYLLRKFDMKRHEDMTEDCIMWKEAFLPVFKQHLKVFCKPVGK